MRWIRNTMLTKTTKQIDVDDWTEPRLTSRPNRVRLLLKCARPHQWLKNLFVLAPLVFGQKMRDAESIVHAVLAVVAFCLASSAVYVFNDIVDASADRRHPKKALRPVASGELLITAAAAGAAALAVCGLSLGWTVGPRFALILVAYLALMIAYCLALKHQVIIDVMVIASGFVLRLIGGAAAVNVIPSHWLILCAFLLALFLALSKRRQEMIASVEPQALQRRVLGEYSPTFLEQARSIVVAAAIVCYALYTVAPETIARVGTEALVYGNIFVIYGFLRYMALMQNPRLGEDPSRMLIRSKSLIAAVLAWGAYNTAVIYRAWFTNLWSPLGQ
jgi:4-hydroxybenzoate polyprenyltransferase